MLVTDSNTRDGKAYWSMMGRVRIKVLWLLPRWATTALGPLLTSAFRLSPTDANDILPASRCDLSKSLGPSASPAPSCGTVKQGFSASMQEGPPGRMPSCLSFCAYNLANRKGSTNEVAGALMGACTQSSTAYIAFCRGVRLHGT